MTLPLTLSLTLTVSHSIFNSVSVSIHVSHPIHVSHLMNQTEFDLLMTLGGSLNYDSTLSGIFPHLRTLSNQ